MDGRFLRNLLIGIFIPVAIGAAALVLFPLIQNSRNAPDLSPGRIITPQELSGFTGKETEEEYAARMDLMTLKAPLEDGEILAAILNEDFNGDQIEEQVVAYRNLLEPESPVYLTYFEYDGTTQRYKRSWSAPTAATRPGTLALYTQDLIGDRSFCVLLSGMNSQSEHTLTVFRKIPPEESAPEIPPFFNIAEIQIDGSIMVREVERVQAYQMGMTNGQSFSISAFGRDMNSSNLLDQIEIAYRYNESKGIYEENQITKIPGTQIEQRRVRELLGSPKAFEEFITGLWYYVSPQGTLDVRQYIYFDPLNREIIFYGDEAQQVFTWQNSNTSRYGLYVSSQNISVSTLRRSIDIELASLDSIKVKVFEDVRIKMGVSAPWDGSYHKAGSPENRISAPAPRNSFINAVYDGSLGKIRFGPDGSFEIHSAGTGRQGKYAFFDMDNQRLLELRSSLFQGNTSGPNTREIYLVETISGGESNPGETEDAATAGLPAKIITLSRVRLGARGIQMLHEGAITLSLSNN